MTIDALHASANALLEYETIEGKHIHEILEHGKIVSDIQRTEDNNSEDEIVEEKEENAKDSLKDKADPIDPGTEPIGAPA